MDKNYVIFDMDGTLVDSMGYWKGLTDEYLRKRGVVDPPAELLERVKIMTMVESGQLFIEEFGLTGTPAEMAEDMNRVMLDHYLYDVKMKPGVKEYLEGLKARGVRMCVASATETSLVDTCLKKMGIRDCFEFLTSCEEDGIGKERPDIYLRAAARLGAEPKDIAVYEDAVYAARTAKAAGFYLVGVYDIPSAHKWDRLKEIADEIIYSYE